MVLLLEIHTIDPEAPIDPEARAPITQEIDQDASLIRHDDPDIHLKKKEKNNCLFRWYVGLPHTGPNRLVIGLKRL